MSISVDEMRYCIAHVYGPRAYKWIQKVEHMSNNQVIAVYRSFVERGLIR